MSHIVEQTYNYLYQKLREIQEIDNCFIRFEALQKLQAEIEYSCPPP
ncbi:hypothetical protein [Halanaerobaculum tunisiense]